MPQHRADPVDTASIRDRWLDVELRHFSTLAAIARRRSFRGAAADLGYVQSAISRQIASLEGLTGARLVERGPGPRPVRLTEEGDVLLLHANGILESIDAAKADLAALALSDSRELRLGVFGGVPTRVLCESILAFSEAEPGVQVVTTDHSSDEALFALVRDGAVELAFVHLPGEPGPFASLELLRMPWVLVVPAGAEIARRSSKATAAEIAALPLITAKSERVGMSIERQLRTQLGGARVVFRSDAAQTAQALAAAGLGAAVVPSPVVEERDSRVAVLDLDDLLEPVGFGLLWHRDRPLSRPATRFRDLVGALCRSEGRRPTT